MKMAVTPHLITFCSGKPQSAPRHGEQELSARMWISSGIWVAISAAAQTLRGVFHDEEQNMDFHLSCKAQLSEHRVGTGVKSAGQDHVLAQEQDLIYLNCEISATYS